MTILYCIIAYVAIGFVTGVYLVRKNPEDMYYSVFDITVHETLGL